MACAADKNALSLDGETVTYTITLTNSASAEAPMINPFLVDLLPQGMLLDGANGDVQLTDAPEGITVENVRSNTSKGKRRCLCFSADRLIRGRACS